MTEVIPGILWSSPRPGYKGTQVAETEVAKWVNGAKKRGIKTIFCLLDDTQLAYYTSVPGGLLDYYRQAGFVAVPHPVADHQSPPVPPGVLAATYSSFLTSQKPLLVHCSAGRDRTGAVIKYILDNWPGASQVETSGHRKE